MVERILGGTAAFVGHLLRLFVLAAAELPGLVAPALVVWGVAQIYEPAAYIVGGMLVFWLDWKRSR